MRQALVTRGIQERQRLKDIHEKKKEELTKQHDVIQRKLEEEREKVGEGGGREEGKGG